LLEKLEDVEKALKGLLKVVEAVKSLLIPFEA